MFFSLKPNLNANNCSSSALKKTKTYIMFVVVLVGTHDIHALILGRAITGLQSFTVGK